MIITTLSAVLSCVQMTEADLGGIQELEKLPLSVTATIESSARTKTVLDGSLSDASMRTVWMPSDNIGVVAVLPTMGENVSVEEFVTGISEQSDVASFEGAVPIAPEYYAFYPYSIELKNTNGSFIFTIPRNQKYVAGSFDPSAAPMVAKAPRGDDFDFHNLCGLLALQLRGSESVKSVTFIGNDAAGAMMPVSGTFSVDMTYTEEPVMVASKPMTSVTLTCDTPVQLSQQATPFYFVLPPATYNSFIIMIQTSDGNVMIKKAIKPLVISRSHVKPTAALQYAEDVYVDLSGEGWANCYVVPSAGAYSFDVDVIGNGRYGLNSEGNFHTDDVYVSPQSLELLWEERDGLVIGLQLVDNKAKFLTAGTEGNALIAAKDADGTILWSWHIWCTDTPADQTYVNSLGTYVVQDRNLGAIRADRGVEDEWKESCGVDYHWGRKDPFVGYKHTEGALVSIEETIQNPTVKLSSWSWSSVSSSLWSETSKTIYDPCPVGYRVAPQDIWKDFSASNAKGDYDNGRYYYCNESDYAWYPSRSNHRPDGIAYWSDCYMTSSTYKGGIRSNSTSFRTTSVELGALRCMKEEDVQRYDIIISSITDVTSTSINVTGSLYVEGSKYISRRGFVYGVTPDVSLDNSTVVESGNGPGDFSASINGLVGSTKYYIKAFAVVGDDIVYSATRSFLTPGYTGVIDLSAEGTSNSYIISQAGSYKFNATVKGNGAETIAPDAVEVVWETLNTSDAVNRGSVISSVTLEEGYVKFETPASFTPGNALIAVKSTGKIVWSWHIWAVAEDMEVNAQLYKSGAFVMDRNLGALSTTPGDVRTLGLIYQWGRKDPFVGCGDFSNSSFASTYPADAVKYMDKNANYNNYNYAESHPSHFIKNSDWNEDSNYWGSSKTMYDPCPVGWRVPDFDSDIWLGFDAASSENKGAFFSSPMSEPTAYYPYSGSINASGALNDINKVANIWTSTHRKTLRVASNNINKNASAYTYYGYSVRCMKDAEFVVTTSEVENIFISDTYIVVPGKVEILDETAMESIGVVYSSIDSAPNLNQVNSVSVKSDDTVSGEFSLTVTELKPNTKYWVRTYAIGGHNVRYGATREIWTRASADNEGYGSEDFEW